MRMRLQLPPRSLLLYSLLVRRLLLLLRLRLRLLLLPYILCSLDGCSSS